MFLKTCLKLSTAWVKINCEERVVSFFKKYNFSCFNQNRLKMIKNRFYFMLKVIFILKDTHREKAPSTKMPAHEKHEYGYLGSWYITSTLCKKFLNWKKIFIKKISYWRNFVLCDGVKLHFTLPILFLLTLASDRTVLYENVAVSILILSIQFFEKGYEKVMKKLKNSSDCHTKTCRSLKRRVILKIANAIIKKNLCSFCWR